MFQVYLTLKNLKLLPIFQTNFSHKRSLTNSRDLIHLKMNLLTTTKINFVKGAHLSKFKLTSIKKLI